MTDDRLTLSNPSLVLAYQSFLIDREAQRCTPKTLSFYRYTLGNFLTHLASQGICDPQAIAPVHIRAFFINLEGRGLKDTTIHLHARAVKTFSRWLAAEGLVAINPMARVAMPRLDKRILPAFSTEDVGKLLDSCLCLRDRAIVLALLDTGCRATEFVTLKVGDVDFKSGAVWVRQGKGRKDRLVFLGAKVRRAVLRYLRERKDVQPDDALWLSGSTGEQLTMNGLALLLRRLGRRAGVNPCSPHVFRRTCALWSLRAGMNIYALQRLMGHADLSVLRRYLALAESDVAEAHRKYSPVDNLL